MSHGPDDSVSTTEGLVWYGSRICTAAKSARNNMGRYTELRRVAIATALFLVTIVLPFAARAQMKARFNWTSPASNLSGSWVAYEEGFFKKMVLRWRCYISLPHLGPSRLCWPARSLSRTPTAATRFRQTSKGLMLSCWQALPIILFSLSWHGPRSKKSATSEEKKSASRVSVHLPIPLLSGSCPAQDSNRRSTSWSLCWKFPTFLPRSSPAKSMLGRSLRRPVSGRAKLV